MGIEVNKKNLAEIIGKSPRWVDKLVEEGMPVSSGGGKGKQKKFDTQDVFEWLVEYQITKRFGDDAKSEPGSAADEDRLLKRARREELQLRIDQKRGLLAPILAFEDIVFNIAGIYTAQLDGLAPRVAGDLAVIEDPAEIVNYIYGETRRIRAATAVAIVEEVSRLSEEADKLFANDDGGSGSGSIDEDAE